MNASADGLRDAYRAKARVLHPDAGSAATTEAMSQLNAAWTVLRDPVRRAAYDRQLRGESPVDYAGSPWEQPSSPRASGFDASDFDTTTIEVTPAVRIMRAAPWIVTVIVLAVIFVFTAFALHKPTDAVPKVPVGVDGRLEIGSCIVALEGQPLRETPCDGSGNGIIEHFVPFTTPCPSGTESGLSPGGTVRVCFRRA